MKYGLRVAGAAAAALVSTLAATAPARAFDITPDYQVDGCLGTNYAAPAGTVFAINLGGCGHLFGTIDAVGGPNPHSWSWGPADSDVAFVTIGDGPGWVGVEPNRGTATNFGVCGGSRAGWTGPIVDLCDGPSTPIPIWVQSYARASFDAACDNGWSPSWEMWPNEGSGGFVCTRVVPALG